LVDEIDVHMHPAWQQHIPKRLGEMFPAVQFLATTHSPLVLGNLEVDEVVGLRRDHDGTVVVERPKMPLKGMGVAGLLTSDLFGLHSQLDAETEELLRRKRSLATINVLSPEQKCELDELERRLGAIDFSTIVRDPLYAEFVKALTQIDSGTELSQKRLTEEERQRRARIAEEVLRDLVAGRQVVE
jgi:hypothetical protein